MNLDEVILQKIEFETFQFFFLETRTFKIVIISKLKRNKEQF